MLLFLISKQNRPGSFLSKSYNDLRIINIILLLQREIFFCSILYSPWNTLATTANPVDFSWLVCSVLHPDARNPAVALLFSRPHLTSAYLAWLFSPFRPQPASTSAVRLNHSNFQGVIRSRRPLFPTLFPLFHSLTVDSQVVRRLVLRLTGGVVFRLGFDYTWLRGRKGRIVF